MSFGKFGTPLDRGTADILKTAANPSSLQAPPPIQEDRFCRNGQYPSSSFINKLGSAVNHAALGRTRELFRATALAPSIYMIASSASTRDRWRGAIHTGPHHHALFVRAVLFSTSRTPDFPKDQYSTIEIKNGAGSVVYSGEFHFGSSSAFGQIFDWQYVKVVDQWVDGLSTDTDYYLLFSDVNGGRIQSVMVAEMSSMTERGGYLAENNTVTTPISNLHRQYPAEYLYNLWRRTGGTVICWTVDDGTTPVTIGLTDTNIIDATSTTISAATPGYTIDMTNRDRLSQTSGVPMRMQVYGKKSGVTNATVKLKNSAGSTIATCTLTDSSANAWYSTTFNMAASSDKYDLHGNAGEFYAVNIYEYET